MISVCYFPNKKNSYLLKEQVDSIVNSEDDRVMLVEGEQFTPETGDEMIRESIRRGCDKAIFIVNEDVSDSLRYALNEEYGSQIQTEVLNEALEQSQEVNTQETPIAPSQEISLYYCNAILPNNNSLNLWNNFSSKILNQNVKFAFMDNPSCFISAAVAPILWKQWSQITKKEISILKDKRFDQKLVEFSTVSSNEILNIINNNARSSNLKYTVYFPAVKNISYGLFDSLNINTGTVPNLSFVNNEKIINLLSEYKSGKFEKINISDEEIAKKCKDPIIQEKSTYIFQILKAIELFKKNGGKSSLRPVGESSKLFGDEFKKFLKDFFMISALEKDLEDNKIMAPILALTKAVKNDLKDKSKDLNKNKSILNKEENEKEIIKLLQWKNLNSLCSFLEIGKMN